MARLLPRFFSAIKRILAITLLFSLIASTYYVVKHGGQVVDQNYESSADQLKVLNGYRVNLGLAPVTENPRYSMAAQGHADYLANTPTRFLIGKYQNLHRENPKSPYKSRDGSTVGAGVINWQSDQTLSAVDLLMTAPFHAIGMMRENLSQVGFGNATSKEGSFSAGSRVSNIAILRGVIPKPRAKTIIFPGPNSVVKVNNFSGENPEPRESCGKNYQKFVGLPIFVSLLHNPSKNLEVKLTWRNGKVLSPGAQLCVVTENNFRTTDPIYGPAGKAIIAQENLVIIIPKFWLSEGEYKVEVSEPQRTPIIWKFRYKIPAGKLR